MIYKVYIVKIYKTLLEEKMTTFLCQNGAIHENNIQLDFTSYPIVFLS